MMRLSDACLTGTDIGLLGGVTNTLSGIHVGIYKRLKVA